jgi:rhomboid protease GluP
MSIDQTKRMLGKNGYKRLRVDFKNVDLYYTEIKRTIYIISLMDSKKGNEIKKSQYNNLIWDIKEKFSNKGFFNIEILNVFFTLHPERVKELYTGTDAFWIVDISENQLIIYENQIGYFLNIRKLIEYSLAKPSRSKYFSMINSIIIVLNILVFTIIEIKNSSLNTEYMIKWGAMYWPYVVEYKEYYRLFSYMFLHFGLSHLFNNMLILGFLGDNLERIVGKMKFVLIYIGSGLLAGAASMGYNIMKETYVVSAGASGAIFGVVGAMLYIVAINKGRVPDFSMRQLVLFVGFSLYSGFSSQGVDNMAHVGGLIGGIVLAMLLYGKPKIPSKWAT